MKMRIIRETGIFLMAVIFVLATTGGALAVPYPYYEAGNADFTDGNYAISFKYNSGTKQMYFRNTIQDLVTGPTGDALIANSAMQWISGTYNFGAEVSSGVYNLSLVGGGSSTITVQGDTGTYITATAAATQIDFNTHTIAWTEATGVSVDNGIGSDALADLAKLSLAGPGYGFGFANFSFQTLANESNWLSGGDTLTKNQRYYSKFEGVPEPAEWALMFIGLGLLGFYLQRKGLLNLKPISQSYA